MKIAHCPSCCYLGAPCDEHVGTEQPAIEDKRRLISEAADKWLELHAAHLGEITEVRRLDGQAHPNVLLRMYCIKCDERFEMAVTK